jgi:hypothetical protein
MNAKISPFRYQQKRCIFLSFEDISEHLIFNQLMALQTSLLSASQQKIQKISSSQPLQPHSL